MTPSEMTPAEYAERCAVLEALIDKAKDLIAACPPEKLVTSGFGRRFTWQIDRAPFPHATLLNVEPCPFTSFWETHDHAPPCLP